jgi:spore maturation protein SpmB
MNTTTAKVWKCIKQALPKSGKTCLWLLKIILPISLGVRLLQYSGLLGELSVWLEPLFSIIGLPGETAIVFITSVFCPLYAPIALISSMALGVREATILALMCLVSHNLIVESSVQSKTGSNFWEITILRLLMSFVVAFSLNRIMPHTGWETVGVTVSAATGNNLWDVFALWFVSSMKVVITIVLIVTALMILHYLLEEFRLMKGLSAVFAPLMTVFGLPRDTAFLWLVGNVVGLAYGGAVMIEQVEQKKLSYKNGNLLNYHLAVSHSMLEDTIIFVAIGIPALWILIPRLFFAGAVVWLRRLFNHIYTSQKIKTPS